MKLIIISLVVFYLTCIKARKLYDIKPEDKDIDLQKLDREHNSQIRHRRQSRHYHYYHDDPYEFDGRRYYDIPRDYRNYQQEELLSKILNKIEELSSYINRPQPPPPQPQIVYMPIPYLVAQSVPPRTITNVTDIEFPPRTDASQIWGILNKSSSKNNDCGDGSRPVNLDPVEPDEPTPKPPPVEHGTSQAGMSTTPKPGQSVSQVQSRRCKAAIVVCCQRNLLEEKQKCFADYRCPKYNTIQTACQNEIVQRAINELLELYGPV